MDNNLSINAIWTILFLLGLIYLAFWRARSFAVDWFRDKMFEMRDSLFDAASVGLIDFDHPAYGVLRVTMNGYIRFCHKASLLHFLLYTLLGERQKLGNDEDRLFIHKWKSVSKDLSPEVFNKLEEYRKQMDLAVITYLILSSPFIFTILLSIALLVSLLGRLKTSARNFLFRWADVVRNSNKIQPLLRNIEDSAYASGTF